MKKGDITLLWIEGYGTVTGIYTGEMLGEDYKFVTVETQGNVLYAGDHEFDESEILGNVLEM